MESVLVFLLFILGAVLVYFSRIVPYYLWRDPKDKKPNRKVYVIFALVSWILAFILLVHYYLTLFGVSSGKLNTF